MRICHLSQTPVAGACWSWSEAFKEAGYDSWCCCPPGYDNGISMPRDEDWPPSDREVRMIRDSDLIFAYQGHPYKNLWYPHKTPTVFLYFSQPSHLFRHGEKDGWPWAVIGQYQPRLYPGCKMFPYLMPLNHPWFQPGEKPTDRLRIAYSPSHTRTAGWDNKGYEPTLSVLSGLAATCDVDIITNTPLQECLKRKSTAHIVIDECVTGAWHGNSAQGLALGCVVLNAADSQSLANLREFAGAEPPFEHTTLAMLEGILKTWAARGPQAAIEAGAANRAWLDEHCQPAKLIENWFEPLMAAAMENAGGS